MKKLLMLGGCEAQMSALKRAKEMGYYIILCDKNEDAPGKDYAHEYYSISIKDKDAILHLARALQVDGIACYAADSGAATVAYVGEKLGLPSHPYESVKILTNKDLFRTFQKENGLNVPNAEAFNTLEEARESIHQFKLPVMIKPVDSSGSRGVSKMDCIEQLEEKVELALSYSKSKRIIIEEYIENFGPHVGGDGFSINGELVFRCFSNEYFAADCKNPFVPVLATWPYSMPNYIQNKIHCELQKLLDLLKMKTGAYNFDIRVDENEEVYLIEVTPRNGGDWNPEAIHHATGIDLIEYTLKAAVGEDCSDMRMVEPSGYWATYVLNSKKSGVFKGVEIQKDVLEKNMIEQELLVEPNDQISSLSGSHEKIGLMILRFKSKSEMYEKMNNIDKLIKLKVDQFIISLSLPFLLLQEKIVALL